MPATLTGFSATPRAARSGEYQFQNVYLKTTEAERAKIARFWLREGALLDPAEAERRSHEVVFIVRNRRDEIVGVSSVGLGHSPDDGDFYIYRMFLREGVRVANLMTRVTVETRDFLKAFHHPDRHPRGMLIAAENPKLMRPGMRRLLASYGGKLVSRTRAGFDLWLFDFRDAWPGCKYESGNHEKTPQ